MLSSSRDIAMALLWQTVLAQTLSDTFAACRIDSRSKAGQARAGPAKRRSMGGLLRECSVLSRFKTRSIAISTRWSSIPRELDVSLHESAAFGCKSQIAELQSLSSAESGRVEQKAGPCLDFHLACVVF